MQRLSLATLCLGIMTIMGAAHAEEAKVAAVRGPLNEMQQYVALHGGTEPAFNNEYWDNTEDGIYVDLINGKPLFASIHKYKSGTGWPSFTQPLEPDNITANDDSSLLMTRTEIKSTSGAHLGHVFNDGPPDKGGKRYCMNSAAMDFIPKNELVAQGYGQYLKLFE